MRVLVRYLTSGRLEGEVEEVSAMLKIVNRLSIEQVLNVQGGQGRNHCLEQDWSN